MAWSANGSHAKPATLSRHAEATSGCVGEASLKRGAATEIDKTPATAMKIARER